MMDLRDLEHNTRDGVHIASLAGTWLAIVAGFGGMRDHGGVLSFHPQLPDTWTSMTFRVRWRGGRVRVHVDRDGVTYELVDGDVEELQIVDCGDTLTLRPDQPVRRRLCNVEPLTERPSQPPGREPLATDEFETDLQPPDDKLEGDEVVDEDFGG
jgi:hypothetical protein